MSESAATGPVCSECGACLVRGQIVRYCVNCDRDEAGALAVEEEAREREEARYDPVLGDRCHECDDYGDYQCSRHGEAVVAQMREEWGRASARDAVETLLACPEAGHGKAWHQLLNAARKVRAAWTVDECR